MRSIKTLAAAAFLALGVAGCQTFDTVFAPLESAPPPAVAGPVVLPPEAAAPATTLTIEEPADPNQCGNVGSAGDIKSWIQERVLKDMITKDHIP